MTHMRQMSESEGETGLPQPSDRECPKCRERKVTYQVWGSSDGGYEDEKFTCAACGHVWWIDGIDS